MTQYEKNWLERNWKWLVPVSLSGALALFAGVIFAFLFFIMSVVKSSDPFTLAMKTARAHPAVTTALGAPIKEGFFVSGTVSTSGPSGKAELSIPLSGPNGSATLYVKARKSVGQWVFSQLVFEDQGGKRTPLIAPSDEKTANGAQGHGE